jgi:hypothetical protein
VKFLGLGALAEACLRLAKKDLKRSPSRNYSKVIKNLDNFANIFILHLASR